MITLVRSRTLRAFEETVAALGVAAGPILTRTGLDADVLDNPEGWVSFPAVIRAYQLAAAQFGEPGFGLKVARRFNRVQFGPLLLYTSKASNLAESIADFGRFVAVQNTGYHVSLKPGDEMHYTLSVGLRAGADQWIEESLYSAKLLIDGMLSSEARLDAVHFRHQPLQSAEAYHALFNTSVFFGAETDMLVFSKGELARPLLRVDGSDRAALKLFLEQRVGADDSDLLASVRVLIEALLPYDRASLENVASILALHKRTLQRRLAEQGQNFSGLLTSHRRILAQTMVREERLPLTHIAMCLGYSEQAAFNHAFDRWFGVSPKVYRDQSQSVVPNQFCKPAISDDFSEERGSDGTDDKYCGR